MDLLMIEPNEEISDQSNDFFSRHFWGEKNLGFGVLQQNMKHGQISVKELQDYVRESASVEELYAKQMMKLAKQAASCSQQGTFYPLMDIFRVMNEKVSSCHMDIVLKLQDIIKDLQKYYDEQKSLFKKHKDTFNSTSESLHNFQAATTSVTKIKEKFYQISAEEDRLKASGVAQKDIDRVTTKLRKAAEEYKNNVGKHAIARHQFEEKMYRAANEFQRLEKEHLDRMKASLDTYILSFENSHVLINQVHQEFRRQLQDKTSGKLLSQYAEGKGTGTDRPVAIVFEEYVSEHANSLQTESIYENVGVGDNTLQTTANKPKKESTGLFGIRRKRGKTKNGSSVRSKEATQVVSEKEDDKYMVDEEGYTIRPESTDGSEKYSFKYSSDSNSDDDDDLPMRKFDVKIKPKESTPNDCNDNVEIITAIAKNLSIGSPLMRSRASSHHESNKTASPPSSSEKKTNMAHDFAKDSQSIHTADLSTLTDMSEASNEQCDVNAENLSKLSVRQARPVSIEKRPAPPIPTLEKGTEDLSNLSKLMSKQSNSITYFEKPPPRPPKPQSVDAEVSSITHNEQLLKSGVLINSGSWSSLSSAEGSIATTPNDGQFVPSFASFSRGPSPLTLSAGDNIPIAVAFLETVHAYFKKGGPSNTLTKITGEVQVSFPAGIIRAFTSTSSAPVLTFKIYGPNDKLQNLTHNQSLLTTSNSFAGEYHFSFDMPALVGHLKKLVEKNPHSPYYNVHIISYLVPSSHSTLPLYLSCSWRCDPDNTHLDIEYNHNSSATSSLLQSVKVIVPVNGSVSDNDSVPKGTWSSSQNRLTWSIPEISTQSPNGHLKSSLAVSMGPSTPSPFAVQFISEGSTLSGAEFQLVGLGYRVSLTKKRYTSGKYLCDHLHSVP